MIIELRGVGIRNKGAELMAVAIAKRFAKYGHRVQLAVPSGFGPFETRARYGFLTKLSGRTLSRGWVLSRVLDAGFRRAHGLVKESEIDAVLDASGFAFGDAWGPAPAVLLERETHAWKERGTKSILLPQAFGPFKSAQVRGVFSKALGRVNLAFARDRESYEHIRVLDSAQKRVRLAPDFTAQVEGALPPAFSPEPDRVWFVPNERMLDKASKETSQAYLPLFSRMITEVQNLGLSAGILMHSGGDERLADQLCALSGKNISLLQENDPVAIKGILGTAKAVIGSRYHALVSALSQNVPCLAMGWSHKYQTLFEEFGCPEMVLQATGSDEELKKAVFSLVDPAGSRALREQLVEANRAREQQIETMWTEVERVLGL